MPGSAPRDFFFEKRAGAPPFIPVQDGTRREHKQDWFVNGVLEVRTTFTAPQLLKALQWVEQALGRVRTEKWGPRTIDIDLLLFGQEIVVFGELIVPHREMHKRRFVLVPLNEIAPYVIHPLYGISMKGLLDRLEDDLRR